MMDSKVRPGMPVVSADGIVLGTVGGMDVHGFAIEGGQVLHGDYRVGGLDVSGVFAGEVYLRKRAADVAGMAAAPETPQPGV